MHRFRSVQEAATQPGRHNYGGSLYLVVRGNSVAWEVQYRENGKLRTKSLGSAVSRNGTAPVTLMAARAQRDAMSAARFNSRQSLRGSTAMVPFASATPMPDAPTFREAADKFFTIKMAAKVPEWTPEQYKTVSRMLTKHSAPIADVPVNRITSDQIVTTLLPIWKGPGSTTGSRVRNLIERVLSSCDVFPNPAAWAKLKDKGLSTNIPETKHHDAMDYADVPSFMRELVADASIYSRALRFLILTATRLDEVLEADWSEFDLTNRMWVIPAARMKMEREHAVPLTDEMLALLGKPGTGLAFPSSTRDSRISQQTLRVYLKERRPDVTLHGFRSSFASWAETQRRYGTKALDLCLAHVEKNKTRKSYFRDELLAERTEIMVAWSKFVTGTDA